MQKENEHIYLFTDTSETLAPTVGSLVLLLKIELFILCGNINCMQKENEPIYLFTGTSETLAPTGADYK